MGYTAPTTRSTGNFITPTIWNTDLVNNISFLANPPTCRVYKSATQSATNGSELAVTYDTELFDTDTMHDTATNSDRVTFTTAGVYQVTFQVSFAANATGERMGRLYLNSATLIAEARIGANTAGGQITTITVPLLYKFTAGQWIQSTAYQNSGGALNVTQGQAGTTLSAVWVGLG